MSLQSLPSRVSVTPCPGVPGVAAEPLNVGIVWDAENRLVTVTQGPTTLASFVYDGRGRRQQKIAGGVTHTYIPDGSSILEERVSTGQTLRYVEGLGIDQHLAMHDGATATYYVADHLGSVAQETNASGVVTLARKYDPWGTLVSGAGTAGWAYAGRAWEPQSDIAYHRARYMDANLGRFLSEDPIGLRGGLNLYAYAKNNPVRYLDALGLAPDPPGCGGGKPCTGDEQSKADALCRKIEADPKAPECLKRGCPARVRCNTDPETCTHREEGTPRPVPNDAATHGAGDVHLCNGANSCRLILHELAHECRRSEEGANMYENNFAPRYCVGS